MAVRQVRQQLSGRVLGRRREVEVAADQERRHPRGLHAAVLVVVGAGRPGVPEPSAAPDEVGARVAEDRAGPWRSREVPVGDGARRLARRPRRRPTPERSGRPARPAATGTRARSRRRPPAESHESSVIGAEIGAAAEVEFHQPEERADPHVARLDRQEPPVVGHVRRSSPQRRGEVVRARAAGARPWRRARSTCGSARRSPSGTRGSCRAG